MEKKTALNHLQNRLDKLMDYYDKWKIKINANKTDLIIFNKRKKFFKTRLT